MEKFQTRRIILSATQSALVCILCLTVQQLGKAQLEESLCLQGSCICDGHKLGDHTDQCGCRCEQTSVPTAPVPPNTYQHTVCTDFNSQYSCCANDQIEAAIAALASEWQNPEFDRVCRTAWESVLCGIYCDPQLATLSEGVNIFPVDRWLGSRTCIEDSGDILKPDLRYRGQFYMRLNICQDDCILAERHCGLDNGLIPGQVIAEYLWSIGFQIPGVPGSGSSVSLFTQPSCSSNFCTSNYDIGRASEAAVQAVLTEKLCSSQCSGGQEFVNLVIVPSAVIPIATICGGGCQSQLEINSCPETEGAIQGLARGRYGVSMQELCELQFSGVCASVCGLTLHDSGITINDPEALCGSGCLSQGSLSSSCQALASHARSSSPALPCAPPPAPFAPPVTNTVLDPDLVVSTNTFDNAPSSESSTDYLLLIALVASIGTCSFLIVLAFACRSRIDRCLDKHIGKPLGYDVQEEEEDIEHGTGDDVKSFAAGDYEEDANWKPGMGQRKASDSSNAENQKPKVREETKRKGSDFSDSDKDWHKSSYMPGSVTESDDIPDEELRVLADIAMKSHRRRYESFIKNPPKEIWYHHVPWLPVNADAGIDWERVDIIHDLGWDLMKLSMTWHPDKFQQHFGEKLHAEEKESILKKVTEISQTLNLARQNLKEYVPGASVATNNPTKKPDVPKESSNACFKRTTSHNFQERASRPKRYAKDDSFIIPESSKAKRRSDDEQDRRTRDDDFIDRKAKLNKTKSGDWKNASWGHTGRTTYYDSYKQSPMRNTPLQSELRKARSFGTTGVNYGVKSPSRTRMGGQSPGRARTPGKEKPSKTPEREKKSHRRAQNK